MREMNICMSAPGALKNVGNITLDGMAFGKSPEISLSGNVVSFHDGADGVPLKAMSAPITYVQDGTGDPSPDNIRQINGWTGITVTHTNANILDYTQLTVPSMVSGSTSYAVLGEGSIRVFQTGSGQYSYAESPIIHLKSNHKYILSCTVTAANAPSNGWDIAFVSWDRTSMLSHLNRPSQVTNIPTQVSVNYTPSDDESVRIRLFAKYGGDSASTADATFTNIMLSIAEPNDNDVDVTYVPYNSTDYSIGWETEAGAVYGGTINIKTGLLTVTTIGETLTGDEGFSLSTNNGYRRFTKKITNIDWPEYKNSTTAFSSHFKDGRNESSWQQLNWGRFIISNDDYLVFLDNNSVMADATALGTWLASQNTAGTPVQVVYEIETPQTVQLTPTEVATLLGDNNIWANTGNVSLTYIADKYLHGQQN